METQTLKKAKMTDIVKYSFGGIGSNIPFLVIIMYMTFFYTDVFGISPLTASAIMLTARLIDAVTDPLMGMLSDNTRCKMGRFRPYIIFGAPFLGLTLFLMFTTPNLTPGQKVVYAYVVYIAYSLMSTVCNIPYHALTAVMSEDPGQRTVIVTWKQGMGKIPGLLMSLALPIVAFFGGDAASPFGWSVFGAIIGICTTISFWICAWGGKPYDTMDKVAVVSKDAPKENILKDLKYIFKNKPLMMALIAVGTDLLAFSFSNAVNAYYFKYVLNHQDWLPTVSMCTTIIGFVAIFVTVPLTKKLGKKQPVGGQVCFVLFLMYFCCLLRIQRLRLLVQC